MSMTGRELHWDLSKNNRWQTNAVTLVLLLVMMGVLASGVIKGTRDVPVAENGYLTISSQEQYPVALRGKWTFYWNTLLEPSQLEGLPYQLKPVPSRWNRGDWGYPGQGHATYVLNVDVSRVRHDLGLKLPGVYRAAEVWVNGRLLKMVGQPGVNYQTEVPRDETVLIKLPEARDFEILIKISSYHHIDGGLANVPVIDRWEHLLSAERERVALGILLSVSFVALGLFLLLLMLSSSMDAGSLYLSMTFSFGGLRILGVEKLAFLWSDGASVEWLLKAEYVGMFLCVSSYMMFLQRLFSDDIDKKPVTIYFALGIGGAIFTLITPTVLYAQLRDPWLWVSMISTAYLLFCMVRIALLRRDHAVQMAILTIMFSLMVLNEILYYGRVTETRISNWGYLIVAVSSVFFWGGRIRSLMDAAVLRGEELQKAVNDSTVELKMRMQDLEKARSAAQEASFRKSEMMAVMSHEVRTPLSGLIGSVELLKEANLTVEEELLRSNVELSGHALLTIVNELLDYSRWDSGHQVVKSENFELREWLAAIHMLMNIPAKEQGCQLVMDCHGVSDEPVWLCGDHQKLRQALINLIHNAIKFSHGGRVTVIAASNGDSLNIQVVDTGSGIHPEQQSKIFDAFVQLENHSHYERTGVGLGLAITHRIITLMGGDISLESEVGRGSCFTLRVPVSCVTVADASPDETTDIAISEGLVKESRILVVEDDQANRLYVSEVIKRAGWVCDTAENGREALRLIREVRFDIVVLDVCLSDCRGPELLNKMKDVYSSGNSNTAPVYIALTGRASGDILDEYGFDYVLHKPLNVREFYELLGTLEKERDSQTVIPGCSSELQNTVQLLGVQGMQTVLSAASESAEESLRSLALAVENHDRAQISAMAHRLRSAALTIHMEQTAEMAKKIEVEGVCQLDELLLLREIWEQELAYVWEEMNALSSTALSDS